MDFFFLDKSYTSQRYNEPFPIEQHKLILAQQFTNKFFSLKVFRKKLPKGMKVKRENLPTFSARGKEEETEKTTQFEKFSNETGHRYNSIPLLRKLFLCCVGFIHVIRFKHRVLS